ncbi:glypican-1 isoform X1 [Neopelma chrysocephalum]|uniref:glypican-1 isoform X1 n=3 Tax=Neopelma chrysocephalum TaxID=114329 RepID=UPI000FCCE968|nr:glypican-1 isoform X1 [Neopelma chrysocephalum]
MRVFPWGFWLLCVASAPARGDSGSKARSCAEVRQLYGAKGFSLSGVPQAEISGEHLRICPQGYTCCTSEMEENFANKSRSEFEAMMKEAGRSVQATLTAQHKSFDSYFQDLLNKSEKALYDAFPSMYGELYTQNMKVFKDLYSELRRYYRSSNINLEEALNEFWTRLLERLFKLMNPQYHITDEYLDCMVKHAEQHKPFGEVPRDLKVKATRAFIAARSYAQGFLVGSDVVKKVSQVSLSHECTRAIMKLMYCPHCRGMSSVRPCNNYCLNVVKGCLANQADLNTEWKYLMDSLIVVADRIDGPYNVDTVIGTIHMRIAEAISNLQENKDSITAKVFQGCGNPKISTKGSSSEDKKRRGKVTLEAKSSAQALEMLVLDAKGNLTALKTYWITLPSSLCSKKVMASSASDDKCWNGMTKGSYLPEVMGDGLANQINNPEVEVDITKPDMTIRQQIMQLKIMTNRLGNANIGNDVDFQDTSDDMSGSGSGDSCPDDVCGKRLSKSPSTRQPETHAIPKQSGHGVNGASSRSLPSASLLLLLLVAVIAPQHLWR